MKFCIAFPIAALAIFACTPVSASEYPTRKPGLWDVTMKGASYPGGPRHFSLCVDEASEAKYNTSTEDYMKGICSKFESRRDGNTWITDSACTFSGSHAISHGVTTKPGEDTYRTEGTTTYDPPMRGVKTDVISVDGKWLGACKPGQTPGAQIRER